MQDADLEVVIKDKQDKNNPAVIAAWKAAISGNVPEEFQQTIKELSEEWTNWVGD